MNEELVKKYAPILFLHPNEKFLPVSPKRFLENANLWIATAPDDDRTMWGSAAAAPVLRQPTAAMGSFVGSASESGTKIDDVSLRPGNANQEAFLELGGWKDADGAHEDNVTQLTSNLYADRDTIAALYGQAPLANVQPWYHAEIYDGTNDRLKRMAADAGPPDFSPLLTDTTTLLFYYLFFPAHQQSLDSDDANFCSNSGNGTKALEAACHAGDWQCIALFLEPDPEHPGDFTPKYIGCTGLRPVNGSAYQFDDDNLTVMKVQPWVPAQAPLAGSPQVDGNHPRFFVSLGSHSLYLSLGDRKVVPFPNGQESQWCGTFDTPSVMPQGWGQGSDDRNTAEDVGAMLAKALGGLAIGGGIGLIAGIVSGAIEDSSGLDVVGTSDVPDPDKVPNVDEGLTLKPAELPSVTGVSKTPTDWAVKQGFQSADGRTYNYLVDRDDERWWPNDDLESGYRGRWGQRVTSDALPRRSGPRFPNYLKMFLLAIAALRAGA